MLDFLAYSILTISFILVGLPILGSTFSESYFGSMKHGAIIIAIVIVVITVILAFIWALDHLSR